MNELSKTEIYELYQATKKFHKTLEVHFYTNKDTWDRHVTTLQRLMTQINPLMTDQAPDDDDTNDIENYKTAWEKLQSYYDSLKEALYNHHGRCNAESKSATQLFDKTLLKSIKKQDKKIVKYEEKLALHDVEQRLGTISIEEYSKLAGRYTELKERVAQLEYERKVLSLERESSDNQGTTALLGVNMGLDTKSILKQLEFVRKQDAQKMQMLQPRIQSQQRPPTPIISIAGDNRKKKISTPKKTPGH